MTIAYPISTVHHSRVIVHQYLHHLSVSFNYGLV